MTRRSYKRLYLLLTLLFTLAVGSFTTKTHQSKIADAPIDSKISAKIIKVVDGDTIDALINGEVKRVRLLGINTPETVDPRKKVECFGKEASNKTKSILTDKDVVLEADQTQADIDKYGRILRYIYLPDGTNFNKELVSEGYAFEYTYDTPYKFQKEFKDAQKYAEQNKLGLWADNACANY